MLKNEEGAEEERNMSCPGHRIDQTAKFAAGGNTPLKCFVSVNEAVPRRKKLAWTTTTQRIRRENAPLTNRRLKMCLQTEFTATHRKIGAASANETTKSSKLRAGNKFEKIDELTVVSQQLSESNTTNTQNLKEYSPKMTDISETFSEKKLALEKIVPYTRRQTKM